MKRLVAGLMCGVVLASAPASGAEIATYKLQRGDVIRLRVLGLADFDVSAMVDVDGLVVLPYLGAVDAENKTIVELQDTVAFGLNGRSYRYVTGDGIDGLITIGHDDVQVSIAEYRPIAVYGAVPNPGEFPFRAGLTVRAALARSGSVRPVADDGSGAVSLRAVQLDSDVRALVIERDHAIAVGWRLRKELQHLRADAPEPAQLPEAIANRWEGQQVALLDKQTSATSEQVNHLNRAIQSLDERIKLLGDRAEAETEVLHEDNAEMDAMNALLQKGVVSNQRVSDVRRAQLFSATRVLQTQDAAAATEMSRLTIAQQIGQTLADREIAILQQIEASDLNVSILSGRIAALQQQLAMLGVSVMDMSQGLVLRIHRSTDAGVQEILATMDDRLEPGDVVEVSFEAAKN